MRDIASWAHLKCFHFVCALAIILFVSSAGFAQSAQDLRQQISQKQSEITSLKQQIGQLHSSNSDLRNQVTHLQNKLQSLQDQEKSLRDKKSQLKTSVNNLRGANAAEAPDAVSGLGLKDLSANNSTAKHVPKSKKSGFTKAIRHTHARPGHDHHKRHEYHKREK